MGEFTCEKCNKTYNKGWSDEASRKEAEELWTPSEMEDGESVVCDDCFNELMEGQTDWLKDRYVSD